MSIYCLRSHREKYIPTFKMANEDVFNNPKWKERIQSAFDFLDKKKEARGVPPTLKYFTTKHFSFAKPTFPLGELFNGWKLFFG